MDWHSLALAGLIFLWVLLARVMGGMAWRAFKRLPEVLRRPRRVLPLIDAGFDIGLSVLVGGFAVHMALDRAAALLVAQIAVALTRAGL